MPGRSIQSSISPGALIRFGFTPQNPINLPGCFSISADRNSFSFVTSLSNRRNELEPRLCSTARSMLASSSSPTTSNAREPDPPRPVDATEEAVASSSALAKGHAEQCTTDVPRPRSSRILPIAHVDDVTPIRLVVGITGASGTAYAFSLEGQQVGAPDDDPKQYLAIGGLPRMPCVCDSPTAFRDAFVQLG